MSWTDAETDTHQDHVIAHVIGASPVGHFIWDETAYILLDIGFIWNIYLDMQMGLLPQGVAMAELGAAEIKMQDEEGLGPIQSVELFESEEERRLVLNCEEGSLTVQTDIGRRSTQISVNLRP
jgi:hypothetical protein